MLKTWVVYNAGRVEHSLTPREVFDAAQLWEASARTWPDHPSEHVIISDEVAQIIASWWHSPSQPYSTMLSTMGQVDRYATLDHFGNPEHAETGNDRLALLALGAYLTAKQESAGTGCRPCACHDCMEISIGREGELCSECGAAGCDPTDDRNRCERDDALIDECGCDVLAYPPGYRCPHDPERR